MAATTTKKTASKRRRRPPTPSIPIVEQEWQVERFIDTLPCASQLRHMLTYPSWKEADLAALVQDRWGNAQGVNRDDLIKMLSVYRRRMLTDKGALTTFYQRVMTEQLKDIAFDLKDVMRDQHLLFSVQRDRVMEMRSEEVTNGFPMSEVGGEIKIASSLLTEMRTSALEMQKIKEKAPPPALADNTTEIAETHGAAVAAVAGDPIRRARMMQGLTLLQHVIDKKQGLGEAEDGALIDESSVHPSQRTDKAKPRKPYGGPSTPAHPPTTPAPAPPLASPPATPAKDG